VHVLSADLDWGAMHRISYTNEEYRWRAEHNFRAYHFGQANFN
jgi:hypothetical protein